MKTLSLYIVGTLVGMAVLMTACVSHSVQCRGTLQPINKPAASSREPKSVPKESRP